MMVGTYSMPHLRVKGVDIICGRTLRLVILLVVAISFIVLYN